MRAALLVLTVWLWSAPAFAAPMCQTKDGDIVHCEAPDAMPVGWKVSPEQFRARQLSKTPQPNREDIFLTFGVIALFFALIALLPEFDGARDGDWDKQEDDDGT